MPGAQFFKSLEDSGGKPTAHVPRQAVYSTEGSKRFAIAALDQEKAEFLLQGETVKFEALQTL